MKTKPANNERGSLSQWWLADTDEKRAGELCGTVAYLKTNQTYKFRQDAAFVRMYSGLSIYTYAGSNVSKMDRTKSLPEDRPTFNLVQACVDTLISRLSQDKPEPKFLTDNADYRQRHLAQQLNRFILGEFYQTKTYKKAVTMLRDCLVMGTGCLKVYRGDDDKVKVERVLKTNLFVDDNDAIDGDPQCIYQIMLMDRDRLIARNPSKKSIIEACPASFPDQSPESANTTTDQVMVVEGWKLPTGPDPKAKGYQPGRHTIAIIGGVLFDEPWNKTKFPFVFMHYEDQFLGFFARGVAHQLFGTQLTLNRILYTIARSITLVGVPRVFIEQGSKVAKAHQNNEIGVIVTYSGTKPSYEVAPCNAPELYNERDKLIAYGFQQTGVSMMQATSAKPEGLDSGAAQRAYDDIATDRYASISQKWTDVFIDLAYLITDVAKDIAEQTGSYQTVYPNKDGTKEIDLPAMKFLEDPFVIQCFTESSLPRTPAGRIQAVTEMVQSGMLTLKEGRRLMRTPQDLEQNEQLDNASEERIFYMLDNIVEDGDYDPPDIFLDLNLATELVVKYINLYVPAKLEPKKADMLRTWFTQIGQLQQAAMPAPQPGAIPPQANPQPTPTSPMVPNGASPPSPMLAA